MQQTATLRIPVGGWETTSAHASTGSVTKIETMWAEIRFEGDEDYVIETVKRYKKELMAKI